MATTDYGLLSSGFSMPTFSEWQQAYFDMATAAFGSDAAISTDSILGQLLSIPAYQDILIWQALEAVYSSQTIDGAEGIYLDEIFNKRGVYRKAAYAGTGYPYIATDESGLWTDVIPITTYFSATNGENYAVSTATTLNTNVAGWCFSKSQATKAGTSMTLYVQNTTTGALVSQTFTTALTSFCSDVVTFIQANIASADSSLVWTDSTTSNIYVGFTQAYVTSPSSTDTTNATTLTPTGLGTATTIYASFNLGVKWSLIPAQCQETGNFPVAIGGITSLSPTPTGYFGVGNLTAFSSGSDVETDAEYRVRFSATSDEATSATRPAVYKAISDLSDVTSVRIYDNSSTVDTVEAAAESFNTVVFGGTVTEIANMLYQKKPINARTDGTTSYTVATEDGGTEVIRYTVGVETAYSIQVKYKTATGVALTSTQQSAISSGFVTLQDSFIAGSTIFNGQLAGVVYKELDFGVLTYLSVQSKVVSDPSTSYSTDDVSPLFNELVTISSDDVTFSQVIA